MVVDRWPDVTAIRPVVVERQCGGWLAVSEAGSILPIGTVGDTEDEARAAFDAALRRWAAIGDGDEKTEARS